MEGNPRPRDEAYFKRIPTLPPQEDYYKEVAEKKAATPAATTPEAGIKRKLEDLNGEEQQPADGNKDGTTPNKAAKLGINGAVKDSETASDAKGAADPSAEDTASGTKGAADPSAEVTASGTKGTVDSTAVEATVSLVSSEAVPAAEGEAVKDNNLVASSSPAVSQVTPTEVVTLDDCDDDKEDSVAAKKSPEVMTID